MTILVDTNVAVRSCLRLDESFESLAAQLRSACNSGHTLVIASQTLFEAYVILTRPRQANGFGRNAREADAEVSLMLAAFTLQPDPPDLVERWRELCISLDVTGKQAHDARLVAFALGNKLDGMITLNRADFARYPGLVLL